MLSVCGAEAGPTGKAQEARASQVNDAAPMVTEASKKWLCGALAPNFYTRVKVRSAAH